MDVFTDLRRLYDNKDAAGWLIKHKHCNPAACLPVSLSEVPDDIRVWEMLTGVEKRAGALFSIRMKDTPDTLVHYLPPVAGAFLFGDDALLNDAAVPPYKLAVPNIQRALQSFQGAKAYLDTHAKQACIFDKDGIQHLATIEKIKNPLATPSHMLVAKCPLVHTHVFASRAGVFASAGAVFAMKAAVTLPLLPDAVVTLADMKLAIDRGYVVSTVPGTSSSVEDAQVRLAVARSLAQTASTAFPCVRITGSLGPYHGKAAGEGLQVFLTPDTVQSFLHFFPNWLVVFENADSLPAGFVASAKFCLPHTDATNVCRDIPEVLQSIALHDVQVTDVEEATAWHVSVF